MSEALYELMFKDIIIHCKPKYLTTKIFTAVCLLLHRQTYKIGTNLISDNEIVK